MTLLSRMPVGPGILLLGTQHVPSARNGHLAWGAAYLGGRIMSAQIAELRAAGALDIYVWAHPSEWTMSTFAASVERAERICRAHGLAGYIADPETPMTPAQAVYFGSMLKDSADNGLSVGLTSFAGYGVLADFARGAAGRVWGLCQIYNRGSDSPDDFGLWYTRFRRLFGSALVCIATFVPATRTGRQLETPGGYETYLGKIPSSPGYASFGSGPAFMQTRLASWRDINTVNMVLWAIGLPTIAHLPVLYSVMLITLIVVGITLFYFFRKR